MTSFRARVAAGASAVMLALAGTLLLAAPANAADVDTPPINTITSSNVDLSDGNGIAVASDGTVYVALFQQGEVVVYAPGATGNVTPEFTITGLTQPVGLAVDSDNNLWVADQGGGYMSGGAVLEFAPGADGNAHPLRDIEGKTTTFHYLAGIALDSAGNIYVTEGSVLGIDIFAKDSTGDIAPMNTISGSSTGLYSLNIPWGIAVGPDGSVVVTAEGVSVDSLEVFAPGRTGDVAPRQVITGSDTQLYFDYGVAVDRAGRIYGSNIANTSAGAGAGTETVYPANADGNASPTTVITGDHTGLNAPVMNAIDSHGNLWVINFATGAPSITEYAALPAITSISSSSGSATGGERVTLNGFYFAADATVTFGGVAATSVVVNSSTSITAVVPAHAAGQVDVVVSQNKGTSSTTAVGAYSYIHAEALPTTGVDAGPALGVGAVLLLLGAVLVRARRRSKFTHHRGASRA